MLGRQLQARPSRSEDLCPWQADAVQDAWGSVSLHAHAPHAVQ